jgi:anti-sigma factor RsiW
MTPEITTRSDAPAGFPCGTAHLTEEQFGDLLALSSPGVDRATSAAAAHLSGCGRCAAEFAGLRESLSLFRQASTAYADNELRHLPPVSLPARSLFSPALSPAYWAAAATLFLAAILPMQSLRQHSLRTVPSVSAGVPESTSQSDEALLDDVDRYTSASVPAPMQVLADPAAGISSNAAVSIPASN